MDLFAEMPNNAHPVDAELQAQLLDPFISAVDVILREMVQTEPVVLRSFLQTSRRLLGEFSAGIEISSESKGFLALGCSFATAHALAGRMLPGATNTPDLALLQDCLGELTNVAAGQAKALLFGTPYHFTLSTPKAATERDLASLAVDRCLVAVFGTELGEIILQIFFTKNAR